MDKAARLKKWQARQAKKAAAPDVIESKVKKPAKRQVKSRLVLQNSSHRSSDTVTASEKNGDALDQFLQGYDQHAGNVLDHPDEDENEPEEQVIEEIPSQAPLELPKLPQSELEPFVKEFSHKRSELDNPAIKVKNGSPGVIKSWEDGGFGQSILSTLEHSVPTPVQSVAIPAAFQGRDVLAVAPTGSGKTLAFVLPLLRHVQSQAYSSDKGPVAIVISPTRELCLQIYSVIKEFSDRLGLDVCCAYGGSDIKTQINQIKRGVQIMVCTPGRMLDLMAANKRRVLDLHYTSFVVIDEADRMFDMGFSSQLQRIIECIRPDKQTMLFSATFSESMKSLARTALHNPVEIHVGQKITIPDTVDQSWEIPANKLDRLLELLSSVGDEDQTIVFVDEQEDTEFLASQLLRNGYKSMSLHGGKAQEDRDGAIDDFRAGKLDALVATSVAARGLDIKTIRLVVNYDPPNHVEDYIHRIGRTGRAGASGKAVTFFSHDTQTKQAHILVNSLPLDFPKDVVDLSNQYVRPEHAKTPKRNGFGGSGLEKLDKIRTQRRSSELKVLMSDEDLKNGDESLASSRAQSPEVSSSTQPELIESRNGLQTKLEFNDYPQKARLAVMNISSQAAISETYGVSLTGRGQFYPPGQKGPDPLHLVIEGPTRFAVLLARDELLSLLEKATQQAAESKVGKYTI